MECNLNRLSFRPQGPIRCTLKFLLFIIVAPKLLSQTLPLNVGSCTNTKAISTRHVNQRILLPIWQVHKGGKCVLQTNSHVNKSFFHNFGRWTENMLWTIINFTLQTMKHERQVDSVQTITRHNLFETQET
jgi:hypothetical protein